ATIGLGRRHAEEAELAHAAMQAPVEFGRFVDVPGPRRDLFAGEYARRVSDRSLLFGKLEIHGRSRLDRAGAKAGDEVFLDKEEQYEGRQGEDGRRRANL